MKLKPLENRVVVRLEAPESQTKSGIIIPKSAQDEQSQIAEVVSIGSGIEFERKLALGDKVIFKKYAGTDVQLENEKFIIVPYDDIIAIIEM